MMILGLGIGVRPAGSVSSPSVIDPETQPATALLSEAGVGLLAEDGSYILTE